MRRGLLSLLIFAIIAVGYTATRRQFDATPSTTTKPTSLHCTSGQLTTTWVDGTGAAGTLYAWVKVTNTSATSCTLPSDPEISYLDAAGGSLPSDLNVQSDDGQLLDWNDNPIAAKGSSTVVLDSGSSAALALSFINDSSCSVVSLFRLSWNGESTSVAPRYLVSQCNGPSGLHSRVYLAS